MQCNVMQCNVQYFEEGHVLELLLPRIFDWMSKICIHMKKNMLPLVYLYTFIAEGAPIQKHLDMPIHPATQINVILI